MLRRVESSTAWVGCGMTVGAASDSVKVLTMRVSAMGIETLATTRLIPNASFNDPATCSNLGTLTLEKDKISTKNAMSRVAISANVAIHAGAPVSHFGHSSSFFFAGIGSWAPPSSSSSGSSPAGSPAFSVSAMLACRYRPSKAARSLGARRVANKSAIDLGFIPFCMPRIPSMMSSQFSDSSLE